MRRRRGRRYPESGTSISIGGICGRQRRSFQELYRLADQVLYEGKEGKGMLAVSAGSIWRNDNADDTGETQMDERSLKKRLNRVTIVVILISILILAGGSVASYYLRTLDRVFTLDAQMESEAEQYKINISRKIDGDFQTLHTLSSFLRHSQMSTENFLHAFNDSRQYNQFIRLGYFPKDGTGTRVTREAGIETGISWTMWTGTCALL